MAQAKVRFGVLGVAQFAVNKMIPALQRTELCEVTAIASRDLEKARGAARQFGIPKAYGSYAELLADPDVEAVYNPLPHHLHLEWSARAAEAGKHVLCEKPIALTAAECRELIAVRDRTGVQIGEAFMVRTHPQWLRARELARGGELGSLCAMTTAFSYCNRDAANFRNVAAFGGGALFDIGCYAVTTARFLFGAEPRRVAAAIATDPDTGCDRLTSGLLEFAGGHAIFTVGTQMVPYQRTQILCERGRVEIEIPFNAPPDRPCRLWVDAGGDLFGRDVRVEEFPVTDQYAVQGDRFARAVRGAGGVPVPLEDALANMRVLDALRRAAASGRQETPEGGAA